MVRLVYKAYSYLKVCMNIALVWKYKTIEDVPIEIRNFSFEAQTLSMLETSSKMTQHFNLKKKQANNRNAMIL